MPMPVQSRLGLNIHLENWSTRQWIRGLQFCTKRFAHFSLETRTNCHKALSRHIRSLVSWSHFFIEQKLIKRNIIENVLQEFLRTFADFRGQNCKRKMEFAGSLDHLNTLLLLNN